MAIMHSCDNKGNKGHFISYHNTDVMLYKDRRRSLWEYTRMGNFPWAKLSSVSVISVNKFRKVDF